jgi:DNA-binding SARP family transcriptional activator
MKHLSVSFLGVHQINLDNVPLNNFIYDKVWALFVYLMVESAQVHHRESLAALLWSEFPQDRARSNLRQALATLRQILDDRLATKPFLLVSRQTIQFNFESNYQSDLTNFLTHFNAVDNSQRVLSDSQLTTKEVAHFEKALTFYGGFFLTEVSFPLEEAFEEWVILTREKLHQKAVSICNSLITYYQQQQEWQQMIGIAERLLEIEPCSELANQAIMKALACCGQKSTAVQQYRNFCQVLEKQLDTTPDLSTIALYEKIQNGGLAIDATVPLSVESITLDVSNEDLADSVIIQSELELSPSQKLDLSENIILKLPSKAAIAESVVADNQYYHRNRAKMLEKVSKFWIKGILENSLHRTLMIELGLEMRSNAIIQPWNLLTSLSETISTQALENTNILDVYDQSNRSLLILGEPGAGKTTLLLDLARSLLARANQDINHPMPVVLNLSSWAESSASFASWVIEELQIRYQVPEILAQQWIQETKILPLLDGLDEVIPDKREDCVQAINKFRSEYWLTDVVVCSRVNDYEILATKLQLNDAVLVQPLSLVQIDRYLEQFGDRLTAASCALHQHLELQELMQTPLMLSILVLVCQDAKFVPSSSPLSVADWRNHLFSTYVQRMLKYRGAISEYDDQAIGCLTCLAETMQKRHQSMFFIEQIQPDLLLSSQQRFLLDAIETMVIALLVGTIGGMGVGVHYSLALGWTDGVWAWSERGLLGLIQGIGVGLLTGLSTGLLTNALICVARVFLNTEVIHQDYRWRKLWSAVRFGAAAGLSQGSAVVIFLGLHLGVADGFLVALSTGIAALKFLESGQIHIFETWGWSWVRAKQGVLPGLLLGLIFGVIYGVEYGFTYAWILAPSVWIVMIAGFGLTDQEIETKIMPNQGIYDTVKGALRISLAVNIPFMLANMVGYGLAVDWPGGFGNGFSAGVTSGICCWLICGGLAGIQHFIVRGLLHFSAGMPWNYAAFLEYAVGKTFLRRVGGGYVFLHRLLLEYFADLATPQSIAVSEANADE